MADNYIAVGRGRVELRVAQIYSTLRAINAPVSYENAKALCDYARDTLQAEGVTITQQYRDHQMQTLKMFCARYPQSATKGVLR